MNETISTQLTPESAQDARALAQQQQEAERAASKPQSSARIVGETLRAVSSGGKTEETEHGFSSFNTSDLTSGNGSSVIATARSPMGSPRSGSDIKPDSIVRLPGGMETTVRNAEHLGLVKRNAAGLYEDVGGSPAKTEGTEQLKPEEQSKPEEEQSAAPEIEQLDEASESLLSEFSSKASNMDLISGTRDMIETGAVSGDVLNRVASQMGVAPEEVASRAAALHAAFTKQAHETLGHNAAVIFDWARENASRELRTAVDQHVMQGTTKGYKALATRFMETLADHSPETILNSKDAKALDIRRERDGRITLNHPRAGRVEWRAAVKAGLIKPHYYA